VTVRQSFLVAYLIDGSEDAGLNPFQLATEIVETANVIRDFNDCVSGDSVRSL